MIILEDLNFTWTDKTIEKVIELWNGGVHLKHISECIKRDGDEVFLLLIHLARKGKIKMRKGYVWGAASSE